MTIKVTEHFFRPMSWEGTTIERFIFSPLERFADSFLEEIGHIDGDESCNCDMCFDSERFDTGIDH